MEGRHRKLTAKLVSSYVLDWVILIVVGVVGWRLGNITPNKRPFQLEDPNISFPFDEHETVSSLDLFLAAVLGPIVVVAIVALVFVPGGTVPRGTPLSLVWRRKLWELHVGWLGLALALCAQWFVVSGMKNLFGKPRPDLLSRCKPDLANVALYVVGGIANVTSNGQLVSAGICTNTDTAVMNDGFRSYPSGHASTSAAGLIYLSLFVAAKLGVTFPFLAPAPGCGDDGITAGSLAAFPSRRRHRGGATEAYELADRRASSGNRTVADEEPLSAPAPAHAVSAVRLRAAAPPLYLLVVCLIPFFTAIFIASSRWFNFRHHGFDILFGFFVGTLTAFFAFYYYQLPLRRGGGWAWGPRSSDKAFWAGVGSPSYAYAAETWRHRVGDEEEAIGREGTGHGGQGRAKPQTESNDARP